MTNTDMPSADVRHARPHVGLAVIIMRDGTVLMGKRRGNHGGGTWSLPGGHLEYGETPEQGALREISEECGVCVKNLRRGPYTNDIHVHEGKHGITLFLLADYAGGEAQILEPEKCERWEWVTWEAMPEPLFLPLQTLKKQGFDPNNQ